MEFRGNIKNGGIAFDRNTLLRRQELLRSLKDDTRIVEIIKRDRASKTQNQCAAIFGVYIPIIREQMKSLGTTVFGVLPSKDFVKDILYKTCGGVGDHGESKTLSQMNVVEAGRFIENIQDFCVQCLDGLQLPILNPNWKDLFKS